MRIIFVWIEKYKKLENFQAVFTGKYNIKYDIDKIVISRNKLFLENFFKINGSNIDINLSAIVGENGTGKSTILDMLLDYMEKGFFTNKYILIFERNGKLFIDSNIEIQCIDIDDMDIKYEIIKDEPLDKFFNNQVTLFFSNVFDVRFLEYTDDKVIVSNDKRLTYVPQIKNISTNALLASYSELEDFLNQDISKQIFFVNEYKSTLEVEKLVEIPKRIYLKTNSLEHHYENFSMESEGFISAFENENVASIYFNFDTENILKNEILKVIIQSFCIQICYMLKKYNLNDAAFIDAYNNARKGNNFFDIIYKNLIKELKLYESENDILKAIRKNMDLIYKDYRKLLDYIYDFKFQHDSAGDYLESNNAQVNSFINFYREKFFTTNILSFYWSEMSSGQLSLLNLFGRFYDSLNEIKQDLVDEKGHSEETLELDECEYLILIDECDLYFHPQWQKDWLYYFLKLIEILFKGNVQVILTTHSPFILSDFPNTNVIFLSDDSRKLTINNEIEGSPRTFGANINELFTNAFFINDGLMGKFAKNKINRFIKNLMNTSPDDVLKNKDKIKTFIDLIGEPFIKNKLLQIYNEKLQLASNDEIEKRIRQLENELNILKQRSDLK